jgi:hypothetical protein
MLIHWLLNKNFHCDSVYKLASYHWGGITVWHRCSGSLPKMSILNLDGGCCCRIIWRKSIQRIFNFNEFLYIHLLYYFTLNCFLLNKIIRKILSNCIRWTKSSIIHFVIGSITHKKFSFIIFLS